MHKFLKSNEFHGSRTGKFGDAFLGSPLSGFLCPVNLKMSLRRLFATRISIIDLPCSSNAFAPLAVLFFNILHKIPTGNLGDQSGDEPLHLLPFNPRGPSLLNSQNIRNTSSLETETTLQKTVRFMNRLSFFKIFTIVTATFVQKR